MSRERELLKRTMDFLECFVFYNEGLELREAIRDFLSTPEPTQDEEPKPQPFNQAEFDEMVRKGTDAWKDYKPEQDEEPIGYVYSEYGNPRKNVALSNDSIQNGTPVYLHPAPRPKFVRLSEEEIMDLCRGKCVEFRWPSTAIETARAIEDALEEANRYKPFVRLTEEEVSEILSSAHTPYEAACAVENRLVEKNRG